MTSRQVRWDYLPPGGMGLENKVKFPVVIHKDPESDYGVTVPDLPGSYSAGSSVEEAEVWQRKPSCDI